MGLSIMNKRFIRLFYIFMEDNNVLDLKIIIRLLSN